MTGRGALATRLLVAGGAGLLAAQPRPLEGLDQYITASMKVWNVPGLAIAVVKGNEVVLARGYGVRELGRPELVTAGTRFAIGSATKAFTATAAGILADRGKLDLRPGHPISARV